MQFTLEPEASRYPGRVKDLKNISWNNDVTLADTRGGGEEGLVPRISYILGLATWALFHSHKIYFYTLRPNLENVFVEGYEGHKSRDLVNSYFWIFLWTLLRLVKLSIMFEHHCCSRTKSRMGCGRGKSSPRFFVLKPRKGRVR